MSEPSPERGELEERLAEAPPSELAELLAFLRHNRKWWLVPMLLVMTLLAAALTFSSTTAAPFVYTLF